MSVSRYYFVLLFLYHFNDICEIRSAFVHNPQNISCNLGHTKPSSVPEHALLLLCTTFESVALCINDLVHRTGSCHYLSRYATLFC